MDRFTDIKNALTRNAKVIVGLDTYNGVTAIAKFEARYANDSQGLHYAQVRIFEKGVKYRTRLAPL